jgi:hypothetical protein
MTPYHRGEMVSFLGKDYPLHTWDILLSFMVMLALLAIYYLFHWETNWRLQHGQR